MTATGAWRVEPLSPDCRDDLLDFFDRQRGRAFADDPAWARCYCHFFHLAPALDWASLDAQANRDAMAARIDVGELEGYVARDEDDIAVGWLDLEPRHKLPHCFARLGVEPPPIDVPVHRAAVVLCFVVEPHARDGIARALLRGALDDAGARGIAIVDAFPEGDGRCAHDRGTRALFAECGFVPERGAMRLRLA